MEILMNVVSYCFMVIVTFFTLTIVAMAILGGNISVSFNFANNYIVFAVILFISLIFPAIYLYQINQ